MVREQIGPVITSLHGSWLGERDGMTRAAKHGEAAVWKNPNDLAILLTAKHYAKYERAAVCFDCLRGQFGGDEGPISLLDMTLLINGDVKSFAGVLTPICSSHSIEIMKTPCSHMKPSETDMESPMRMHFAGLPDTEPPLFLAVGRLVARKGYRTLLKAMPDVLKSFPRAHLVIVGRGHEADPGASGETPRSIRIGDH